MPEDAKGCAMFTSGRPFSRAARAEGIQSMTTSAPPPAITWVGAISGPTRQDGDVQPLFLIKALGLRHIIARELGLRDPFQLQLHILGLRARRQRRQERSCQSVFSLPSPMLGPIPGLC